MYENFPFLFFFVVTAVVLETMISGKLLREWVGGEYGMSEFIKHSTNHQSHMASSGHIT